MYKSAILLLAILLFSSINNNAKAQISVSKSLFGQVWSKAISKEIIVAELERILNIENKSYRSFETQSFMAAMSGDLSAVIYKSDDPEMPQGLFLLFYDDVNNYGLKELRGKDARQFLQDLSFFLDTYDKEKRVGKYPNYVFRTNDIRISMSGEYFYILWNGFRSRWSSISVNKTIKKGMQILDQ